VTGLILTLDAETSRPLMSFLACPGQGQPTQVRIDGIKTYNVASFQKHMGSLGLMMNETTAKKVYHAMTSWLAALRDRQDTLSRTYSRLGWEGEDFVLADNLHTSNGVLKYHCDNTFMMDFTAAGTASTHTRVLDAVLVHEQRPEMHALFSTSFAAPLLRLAGGEGMSLNFFSPRSAAGKTLMAHATASVWGKPTTGLHRHGGCRADDRRRGFGEVSRSGGGALAPGGRRQRCDVHSASAHAR
jgi:hypothetical protein